MNSQHRFLHTLSSLFLVTAGNILYALAVKLFLLPSGLVTGGTTGISLTINHFFHVPITQFVLIFNVTMLIAGFLVLGKSFAFTTLTSTFSYPLALEFFDRVFGDFVITNDLLLCTLFSGLGIGISLGIVIRSGASTGGMDIPPLILQKKFRIPVSISMYAFDVCILLAQALFRPAEDIRNAILTQIDRGVTMLDAEGGYLHNKTQIVLSIISNRELPKVEKLIRSIDPESFMVISHVKEVSGRGFSMKKRYGIKANS